VAADPGLTALHRAVRTTLTVMCAVLTVYLALPALGFGTGLTIPLLAGVVGLLSSFAVSDPTLRQKHLTMLLLALVAIMFVFAGTVLDHYQVVKSLALLTIIFVAYYLRHFGPKFLALGMIGFMTFYFSSLIGTTLGQMPELIGAIAVGVGWAFVFTFLILPDRPAGAVRAQHAPRGARTALVLDVLCEIVGGEKRDHALTKRLRRRLTRLNDTAMAIEGQLSGDAVDADALGARPDRVRMFIFDALLSIETIAASVQYIIAHDAGAEDQARVDAALLGDAKEDITASVNALIGRIDGDKTATGLQDLDSVEELIEVGFAAMRAAQPPQSSVAPGEARGGAAAAVGAQPPVRDGLVRSLHFIWHINQAIVDLAVDLGARRPETTHR